MKEYGRREFLGELGKGLVLGAAFLSVTNSPRVVEEIGDIFEHKAKPKAVEPLKLYEGDPHSLKNLMELSVALTAVRNEVRPHTPPIQTQADVDSFSKDIVPFFYTTGIEPDPSILVFAKVNITDLNNAATFDEYNGALGFADCTTQGGAVTLNSREFFRSNTYDDWGSPPQYGEIYGAIAHELQHMQASQAPGTLTDMDFCSWVTTGGADRETLTQIGSTIALTAAALDGNRAAFAGTVYQLRRFVTSTLLWESIEQKDFDAYNELLDHFPNASAYKASFWENYGKNFNSQYELDGIKMGLDLYGRQPYLLTRKKMMGKPTPELQIQGGKLDVTDMRYFIKNIEGLASDYIGG